MKMQFETHINSKSSLPFGIFDKQKFNNMKKVLPLVICILSSIGIYSQCDDLFFSEYVEGYSNNKALEIYNPTDAPVNLSEYSIARASNGSTSPASNQIISLPDVVLEPKDVFVVVVDLRDTSLWDSQFDKPAWNGYNLIDTLFDAVTNEPIVDSDGNVVLGPQYSATGSALFGDEYNEMYDLQCKADAFLCPDYDQNNTMYFNGNDAMILLKGSQIASDGSNLVDVIGVIGEDPEDSIGEDAWINEDGFWLTKNRTLVRKPEVETGRNELSQVVFSLNGTFTGEDWFSYRNNTFDYLGIHNSVCNNDATPDRYSCSQGPLASNYNLEVIAFNVYPNPINNGVLNIESEVALKRIEIYSVIGQKVFNSYFSEAQNSTQIQLSGIEKGVYVVRVVDGQNQWATQKLIVE